MKKTSIVMALTISLLLTTTSLAFASNGSQDFNYVTNPPFVQVSPDAVVPSQIPNCTTGNHGVPTYPVIFCYSPAFIRSAYNFGPLYASGFDGTGQTIVIVDAFGSPTITQDLAHFDSTFGINPPPSFTVLCDPQGCPSFSPRNSFHDEFGWTVETSLDVEYAHAMAPGASIVLVVASTSSGNAINVAETRAIQLYPGSIMSQSFGIPESLVTGNNAQILQAESNYQSAAAAGITVLASAGDSGATNGGTFANALFPSSDPLVTSVGGTQGNPLGALVTFTGTCPPSIRPGLPTGCTPTGYGAESVWNEAWLTPPAAGGGSPSLLFGLPSYQGGLGLTSRTTPDVSYNAAVDGGVLVFNSALGAHWFVVGGTSAGSPQWASIFAIVNQERASAGKGPIGFANPALYSIAESSSYSSDFHDITVGNNQLAGTPVGFLASTGYDAASGWGTPNVANLVPDLASS